MSPVYCDFRKEAEWWQPLLRDECEIKACCRLSTTLKGKEKKREGGTPFGPGFLRACPGLQRAQPSLSRCLGRSRYGPGRGRRRGPPPVPRPPSCQDPRRKTVRPGRGKRRGEAEGAREKSGGSTRHSPSLRWRRPGPCAAAAGCARAGWGAGGHRAASPPGGQGPPARPPPQRPRLDAAAAGPAGSGRSARSGRRRLSGAALAAEGGSAASGPPRRPVLAAAAQGRGLAPQVREGNGGLDETKLYVRRQQRVSLAATRRGAGGRGVKAARGW